MEMAQMLGAMSSYGRSGWYSWLWLGPTLVILTIWKVNQEMDDLYLFLSLCKSDFKWIGKYFKISMCVCVCVWIDWKNNRLFNFISLKTACVLEIIQSSLHRATSLSVDRQADGDSDNLHPLVLSLMWCELGSGGAGSWDLGVQSRSPPFVIQTQLPEPSPGIPRHALTESYRTWT